MSHSIELSPPQEPAAHTTEVVPTARKKRYAPAYKRRVIDEADRCTAPGELGALLRREGIYFSTLTDFRKQKARADFKQKARADFKLKARTTAKQKQVADPQIVQELAAAQREGHRLRRELHRATALLDIQKKSPRSWD